MNKISMHRTTREQLKDNIRHDVMAHFHLKLHTREAEQKIKAIVQKYIDKYLVENNFDTPLYENLPAGYKYLGLYPEVSFDKHSSSLKIAIYDLFGKMVEDNVIELLALYGDTKWDYNVYYYIIGYIMKDKWHK